MKFHKPHKILLNSSLAFFTFILVSHYGFYAVTDDMYLNYELLNIFPIIHMFWGLWFIIFSLFLIFQLNKSKYFIVPLVIFFSLANLLVGILRLDRHYEVIRNDNHKIYVEQYQFLWVRTYYFYYEVNALYSVYINYISEDESESSYELVGDQLILREFKTEPYELFEEKTIDLLSLVG
ncbi:MAG: hypothetical protein ACO22H_00810 [Bacilli bacterium]